MEKIKEVVAAFINYSAVDINELTVIDKSVIKGSILIHRMYAALSDLGYHIKDYSKIRTYGDLIKTIQGHRDLEIECTDNIIHQKSSPEVIIIDNRYVRVGVDIEWVNNLPIVNDFRSDNFYAANFSEKEISYCLLSVSPIVSFAGLFAAKEALCKADNNLMGKFFKQIEISHDANGKPIFQDFELSISHTDELAVAIVVWLPQKDYDVKKTTAIGTINPHDIDDNSKNKESKHDKLLKLTFILSIISLIEAIIYMLLLF